MRTMMNHCMIVGGTGMLREVAIKMAGEGNVVSVIGRSQEKLIDLVRDTRQVSGIINPVMVDYTDTTALAAKLNEAISHLGPIKTAIVWIHADSPGSRTTLLDHLTTSCPGCRVFDLHGHKAADPDTQGEQDNSVFEAIEYHKIIMGWQEVGNSSRWLKNEEIVAGVFEAVEKDKTLHIIGTVEPWSKRP